MLQLLLNNLDVLVLTESWHGSSENLCLRLAMPPGYSFYDFLRPHDPYHGGIIIYFKKFIKNKLIELPLFKSFEAIAVNFFVGQAKILLLALYRPGSASITNLFFDELKLLLEHLSVLSDYMLVTSDFNVHIERLDDPSSVKLNEIFDLFQLSIRVTGPTHIHGGTLDLIVSSNNFPAISCTAGLSGLYSDHSFVEAVFPLVLKQPVIKKIMVRSWNRIDCNQFTSLISSSPICKPSENNDVDFLCELFEKEIQKIVDVVAPLHYVMSRQVPSAPWFDGECRQMKKTCRKFERIYKKNPTDNNKNVFKNYVIMKNNLFVAKKNSYWKDIIDFNKTKPKVLWSTVNKILCKNKMNDFSDVNIEHTSIEFSNFFKDKIDKVRNSTTNSPEVDIEPRFFNNANKLSQFVNCTCDDVKEVIFDSPAKSCLIDCIPTKVLKLHIDLFLPFLTHLINSCFLTGRFPSAFKHAVVTPILKKSTLDKNNLSNYRPVSNLKFLSKIIERIVAKQLTSHLKRYELLPIHQSGYREFHSTESALIHVSSSLFASMDSQDVSLLSLLDMSAAFDCVDHKILLKKLDCCFGISGDVAKWFCSYLTGRTQQVLFNGEMSPVEFIKYGVPQGSVLGPLLFLLYTTDVFRIIDNFGFRYHAFADDIQIVASCPVSDFNNLTQEVVCCLMQIDLWMASNRLKLNACKTQLLPIGTWQQLRLLDVKSIKINDDEIFFCSTARNLGVIFDTHLSMDAHVKSVSVECRLQLRQLRLIRKSLNESTLKTLVHAFIHSKVDYCSSLLYGISNRLISRLQSIQNQAARLVLGGYKFEPITPLLRDLHWLPVQQRIFFKTAVMVFKCLNGHAPSYLNNMISIRTAPTCRLALRSDTLNYLNVFTTQLVVGSRSFSSAGPTVWNSLPLELRQPGLSFQIFRKKLKSYLFGKRFSDLQSR